MRAICPGWMLRSGWQTSCVASFVQLRIAQPPDLVDLSAPSAKDRGNRCDPTLYDFRGYRRRRILLFVGLLRHLKSAAEASEGPDAAAQAARLTPSVWGMR